MIKATKTNDYQNNDLIASSNMSEDSAILINNKILQGLNDECKQITCEEIKLLKFNGDLVQLEEEEDEEEEEENDIENNNADDIDEDEDDERDLTNLTWLTELRNQTMGFVNIPLYEETKKDNDIGTMAMEEISIQQSPQLRHVSNNEMNSEINTHMCGQQNHRIHLQIPQHKSDEPRSVKMLNQTKRPSPAERYEMFLNKIKRDLEIYEESAINYQSDIVEKPPFNYSHIIGMAMLENGRRVTLQQICSWIERKFAFFRVRKKWNNSIRHNLSLHPCFRKIGRNKEDKGKGGYWELGVDPKKCDRKRIRNRKSTTQPAKMQKKHLQAHFIKSTKRRQQNFSNCKRLNLKHCMGYLRNYNTFDQDYEELLLDEMDVQQNIDVMSTNTNPNQGNNITSTSICYKQPILQQSVKDNTEIIQKDEEDMLTNFIDDCDDDFSKSCSLAGNGICPENKHQSSVPTCQQHQQQQQLQQQYKLGTLVISSAIVGANMPNIESISQPTTNSFLTANSTKKLLTEEPLCTKSVHYSEEDNGPQSDNVIVSSYISNFSDDFSSCDHEQKPIQCQNLISSTSSITLDFSAFPTQSIQQKANVIVEQLIQQPSASYSAIEFSPDRMPLTSSPSPSSSSTTATMCTIGPQNGDYAIGFVNEHFRPYIDGIDEAFQYLRSIDNARNEDILDNLLDISVSDY